MKNKKANTGKYRNEMYLDKQIQEFQVKFGIIDEGQIVANDDYEKTVSLDYEDMKLRRV